MASARARTRDTRGEILSAAAEEFAQHGPQGARVQVICRRARVNERMLYHHFASKEGLYTAVLEHQWQGLAEAWQPLLAEASGLAPRPGLERAFVALGRLLFARPFVLRLAMQEAMSGWRYAPRATIDQVPAELRALHRRGQRAGDFRRDVPFERLYFAILGALGWHSVFGDRFDDVRAALTRDPAHGERLGAQLVGLILDGLAQKPAPTPKRRKQ